MERSSLTYPTKFMQPEALKYSSRVVREVVYEEMKTLSSYRVRPDVRATCRSVREIEYVYRRLEYSLPELLSTFEEVNVPSRSTEIQLVPEMVPWELVPTQLIERCLDENMELQITDELLEFLGRRGSSSSIFSRVRFPSRFRESSKGLIEAPVYRRDGKRLYNQYYFVDQETGTVRKALIRTGLSSKTPEEIEYVVDSFGPDAPERDVATGLSKKLLLATVDSVGRYLDKKREMYLSRDFIEQFSSKTIEQIHRERDAEEREYAVSKGGKYLEDTTNLWRLCNK